jgi:EAL and modified HD-GYP domain-containing signal transduction protein
MTAHSEAVGLEGVAIARQPVLDVRGDIHGYELLFRESARHTTCTGSPGRASAVVLDAALVSLGLDTLTGGRRAYFNITTEMLLNGAASLIPRESSVLEVLETVPAEPGTIEACRALHASGYTLALDDFVPGPRAEALLPFAKIAKLDVLSTSPVQMTHITRYLRGRGITVVAEKVETIEAYEAAKAAGCTLFQGYYFCRPQTIATREIPPNHVAHMQLVAALNRPNVSAMHVEELLKQDPRLSLRILRCVNSAAFATRREIQSIREAVVMLGINRVRQWAAVWLLTSMNGGPREVASMAVLRARLCERLGDILGEAERAGGLFLLGLTSLLDVMIQQPMAVAIAELPLSAEIRAALLGEDNRERRLLDAVVHYERGDWEPALHAAERASIDISDLADAYQDALLWAKQFAAVGGQA